MVVSAWPWQSVTLLQPNVKATSPKLMPRMKWLQLMAKKFYLKSNLVMVPGQAGQLLSLNILKCPSENTLLFA